VAWQAHAAVEEHELDPKSGEFSVVTADPARGLLTLAPGGRTVAWSDGSPLLVVADTAWAMPWRAIVADIERYAADRHEKGFNAYC
jgi:hypothetical protein